MISYYVELSNSVAIEITMDDITPLWDTRGGIHYPPEPENEAEVELAEQNARFWLREEGKLELPATHRFSVEALEIYRGI